MKKNIFSIITTFIFSLSALADSPLFSIAIAEAYQDVKIVNIASKSNGKLTPEIMKVLSDNSIPVDIKMAAINAVVIFSEDKQPDYSATFYKFLISEKRYRNEAYFIKNADGDTFLSMAYLIALDGYDHGEYYFDNPNAHFYANQALQKNPKSWTYNVVARVIKAEEFHHSTDKQCQVFKLTDEIRNTSNFDFDMRSQAKTLTYRYMDQYKEDCHK